jgi:CHASE2 domain-containing sensor protein/signal transduction histidine kinase
MSPTSRWGYTGLIVGVTVALGVWILQQAGWLAGWDGAFYDRIVSSTIRLREPKPKVLLLRIVREDTWSEAEANKTLDILQGFGARTIVLDSIPPGVSREFFQRLTALRNVAIGRQLRPAPDNPDTLRLEPWPAQAGELQVPWGVVFLSPAIRGVHRWQQSSVLIGTNTFPTVEGRAAALAELSSTVPASTEAFLVNFVGGPGKIPNISISKVLAGELIAEMVKGKVVLVGASDEFPGLATPVSSGAEPMSFLEFQGNALQTVLDARPIRPLPWALTLLLLVGLAVISSVLYQRVDSLAGVRLLIGMLLVCALSVEAALVLFNLWLPLGALVLAQGGQFALTLVFKTRMTSVALNEMRLHALRQLKERLGPPDFLTSLEHWELLASMINQTVKAQRMVFLERLPGTEQLREAKAINCTFDDVQEKDRSLDAPMFAAALTLARGGPARIDGFFNPGQAQEDVYLCPLAFGGELLAVWVAGFDTSNAAAVPQLDTVLTRLSQQMARLLHQRKYVDARSCFAARLKTWFSSEKGDQTFQELSRSADALEQYYDTVEAVFNQGDTATLVYDSFGRVLKASDKALVLLQSENFAPGKGTAVELLLLLTRKDELEVRRLLRNVLLERSPTALSIKLPSQRERQFLLRLHPLLRAKQSHSGPEEGFTAQGLVCELIDTTSLSILATLKALVAERLGVELRDHLAAIEMAAALLESDGLAPAERQAVLEVIHSKTDMCVGVITECQKYLGRGMEAKSTQCFPLDALEVLDGICAQVTQKAAERHITVNREQPRLMAQVMASTEELEQLFTTVLELLVADAAEDTPLSIRVNDASSLAIFQFSNCGFGIPNERLQEILTSPEMPASKQFQVLREAAVRARDWGGHLDVWSEVGKGYSITLELRQFQLTALLSRNSAQESGPQNAPKRS